MDIQLVRVDINEANDLWEMQVASFLDLYEKYQDTETSTATESVDKSEEGKAKRISPIFIIPEYRNKGYTQIQICKGEFL